MPTDSIGRIRKSPFLWLSVYYALLGLAVALLVTAVPELPRLLDRFRGVSLVSAASKGRALTEAPATGLETFTQGELALITLVAMLAALALVVPVAWVYTVTKQRRGYDQSVVQAVIILPITVAGTVILVQNSLALAFALAAVVAVVRFRNTLKDTKDTVYIFLALGVGVAAGVFAPTVAGVMSLVFNIVVLLLWRLNIGNIYADQRVLAGGLRPAEALLGPGKAREALAIGNPELLAALTPEELDEVADRAARLQAYVAARAGDEKKKRFTGVLLVHANRLPPAQDQTEALLEEYAKRWKLAEIVRAGGDVSTLEYLVRLRDDAQAAALLDAVKARGAPHVVAAEFRSLRGLKPKES